MRGSLFFLSAIGVFFFVEAGASAASSTARPLPKRMAAFGDSMSEAILADYSFESGISNSEAIQMVRYLEIRDKDERMQAFRRDFAAYDKAWATGDSRGTIVSSHYERLSEYVNGLEAYNFAVAGAMSSDLASQVEEAVAFQKAQGIQFDYVTLMMGANDLGFETIEEITHPARYIASLESSLRRLAAVNPEVSVLIVGVPDILQVFEKTRQLVVRRLFGVSYTCDRLRRSLYGNNPVFRPEDVHTYEQVKAIIRQYQLGIDSLAVRLNADFPDARFQSVPAIRSDLNVLKLISVDCFHPSEWGQAELAEKTWRAGFWPELGNQFD